MFKKISPVTAAVLILLSAQIAFAARGGAAHYKMTKPYITKTGQFRSSGIKDVSANGNKYDNANYLGLNGRK